MLSAQSASASSMMQLKNHKTKCFLIEAGTKAWCFLWQPTVTKRTTQPVRPSNKTCSKVSFHQGNEWTSKQIQIYSTLVTACQLAHGCPVLCLIHIVYHTSCLQYPNVPRSIQVFNEKQVDGRWLFLSAGVAHDTSTVVDDMEKNLEQVLIWCAILRHLLFLALKLCHI